MYTLVNFVNKTDSELESAQYPRLDGTQTWYKIQKQLAQSFSSARGKPFLGLNFFFRDQLRHALTSNLETMKKRFSRLFLFVKHSLLKLPTADDGDLDHAGVEPLQHRVIVF